MSEVKHTPLTLETVKTSCGVCHKIGPLMDGRDKLNYACIYDDCSVPDWQSKELLERANFIVTAHNAHEELVEALKVLAKHFIRESQNALGPGHLFCDMCGRNSDTDTHFDGCPVLKAEQALAKAGRP